MGLFSGKKGESLFSEPLLRFFRENPLPELYRKYENSVGPDVLEPLLTTTMALFVDEQCSSPKSGRERSYE
jgi:hypothetical protein